MTGSRSEGRRGAAPAERVIPGSPLERLTRPILRFLHIEAAAGIVLLLTTIAALVAANSELSEGYRAFWERRFEIRIGDFGLSYPLWYWVNDGLMAIFFFVIGLEIKRELVHGELRDVRNVVLPVVAEVVNVEARLLPGAPREEARERNLRCVGNGLLRESAVVRSTGQQLASFVLKLEEVAAVPAAGILDRLVENLERRVGSDQESPPDARLDLTQGDLEVEVLGHGESPSETVHRGEAGSRQPRSYPTRQK